MPGASGQAAGRGPASSEAAGPQAPGAAAGAVPASAEPGIPGAAAEPTASGEAGATPSPAAGRGTELRSGPFRLSEAQRRLWKDGAEIVLTPTEWTLVRLLMERAGEGLSRDEILNAVWGRHFVGDLKIVDVNIRRIRQKLEDEPSEPKYIETLWGYGYRWERSE
ncbi:winged helix-turn-helix domain-containing protein [Paenibacillus humicola]|uniref:winged helix-turn-helix domain-containing protein n=1 Tax=Paenibacillus humicola TaxID=3110540 RepID=UPI0030846B96